MGDKEWRNMGAVRLPKILVLTIDGFVYRAGKYRASELKRLKATAVRLAEAKRLGDKADAEVFYGASSLRVFHLFAFIQRAQGSSGAVATMPFVWRSHAKSPTTRAGRALDTALWLE